MKKNMMFGVGSAGTMDRREVLASVGAGLGALAASAAMGSLLSTSAAAKAKPAAPRHDTPEQQAAIAAIKDCIAVGEVCQAHCIELLATGDTTFANCTRRVQDMLILCAATLRLAARDSEFGKRAAELCAEACQLCADACYEHSDHWSHGMHLECQACFDACTACVEACREYSYS